MKGVSCVILHNSCWLQELYLQHIVVWNLTLPNSQNLSSFGLIDNVYPQICALWRPNHRKGTWLVVALWFLWFLSGLKDVEIPVDCTQSDCTAFCLVILLRLTCACSEVKALRNEGGVEKRGLPAHNVAHCATRRKNQGKLEKEIPSMSSHLLLPRISSKLEKWIFQIFRFLPWLRQQSEHLIISVWYLGRIDHQNAIFDLFLY